MDITPAFAVNATEAEINALVDDDRVVTIEIDRIGDPHLIQSVPLIGMTNAYAAGATGQGWAVAVLDTGVEANHTFLAGQMIAEACFSTTTGTLGSGGAASLCPGGASSSTAAGSGANCNIAWSGCGHGTHVAGIAVGLNSQFLNGQPPNGVAESGRLIAIKMYSEFTGADCGTASSPCVKFFFSDFIRALDHVYSIRNSLPGGTHVAAINLSGGGGHFSPPNCDAASTAMKTSIDNLRSVGIATIISAGNGGSTTQIGQPACISSAIAIAASTKGDVIASYTDISTQVAVFAPGSSILSSVPTGFNCGNYSGPVPATGGSYCYFDGTSMAAPTVAGAWAAIRTVCPSPTVDQILDALISTGTPITDNRSGGSVTKNRIRVDLAVQQLACIGPTATTQSASSVTSTSATLNGTVNPNGLATTASFQWGTTTAYGNTTPSQAVGSGTTSLPVSALLSGLAASTTYHYRVVATSSAGTTNGADMTFTTAGPFQPSVTTNPATNVTTSGATLNGTVNPNGLATTASFQWGTTTAYGNTTASQALGSGTSAVTVSATLSGLAANTTYHFRAVATNSAGTTNGMDMTFTTGVCSLTPISLGQTLSGTLSASDCPAPHRSGSFADLYTFTGTAGQPIVIRMQGFDTYLFLIGPAGQVVASNDDCPGDAANSCIPSDALAGGTFALPSAGTYTIEATSYYSAVTGSYTLSLSRGQPTVTTNTATGVTAAAATVNGTVNPNGAATTAYFQWGATTAYGNTTASQSVGSGTSNVPVSATLSGLTANTTYHYRVVATNNAGTATGADLTFTTTPPGCTTAPVTLGQTITGALSPTDCAAPHRAGSFAKLYTFTGTAGQPIVIRMQGFDTYLFLIGPTGLVVASNDDCPGDGTTSCIPSDALTGGTFTLPSSGTYTIEATSHYPGATGSYNLSLSGGATAAMQFTPVTPCRIMDTRNPNGPLGGPFLPGGTTRSIPILSSSCGIPSAAGAYALNVTVVPRSGFLGYLTLWPAGQSQPLVSTLNSQDGSVLANAAIVPAGLSGAVQGFVTDDTDLVLDVTGYFAPPSAATLQFYALPPCRVLDTRNAIGPLGGPSIAGGTSRPFPIPSSACGVPPSANAYSLNVTVVPHFGLGYLTAWPTGQSMPLVSTLNSYDGTVLANAAIVPAGTAGAVSFFATDATDLVVDINGYFGPPGATGLNFHTVSPCRVVDTRDPAGPFGGPIIPAGTARSFPLAAGPCGLPSTAAAYSLNMTVVPTQSLGYLTTWPTGQGQPLVSTLNDPKGLPVANAALVPAGTAGAISVFVTDNSHVVIDANGYFAQ